MSDGRALHEIEVAYRFDFKRWKDFEKALRDKWIPGPDLILPDGRRWLDTSVNRLLLPNGDEIESVLGENKVVQRLRNGENAPPPGTRKARR
ncbi:MAG: hypothetical protein H6851_07680 [Geminicoccaceae bacterium]|nr:hypothetical protein [Geminicoccaceae bacterium]